MGFMISIEKQIEKNICLLKEIETLAKKISIPFKNEQEMLFSGFFRNTLSHYYSINILCEKKLYNSSFVLIRILFEGVVRAEYLYCGFTDDKIHNIYNESNWDNAFPSIGAMCNKIDEQYGSNFYSDIKNNAYKAMNDYTHTGFNQISRNFNSENGVIETNFDKELIIDSLIGVNNIVKILSIGYFEKIGLKYGEIQYIDIDNFQLKST